VTPAPGGLQLNRDRDLAGRRWHPWFRRGLLALVALLPLLALTNLFGQHPETSIAKGDVAELEVYAPGQIRGGDMFEVRIHIHARETLSKPALVLNSGWFEQVTLNGVAPQSSTESGQGDQVAYHYDRIDAGKSMTVWIYFQVNPTDVGRREASILLRDGSETVASIHKTITVFP
jgi:hypothetical protein